MTTHRPYLLLAVPLAVLTMLSVLPGERAHAAAPTSVTPATAVVGSQVVRQSVALRSPDGSTARSRQAVNRASRYKRWPARTCMVFVRTALGVGPRYGTPRVAWSAARHKHRSRYDRIPAGVPVYTHGRSSPGHIMVSLGRGMVRSTDWPSVGRVGTVRLSTLLRTWGHRYLGWSEDLNGVRVWHR